MSVPWCIGDRKKEEKEEAEGGKAVLMLARRGSPKKLAEYLSAYFRTHGHFNCLWARDGKGRTALHVAARRGRTKAATVLLEHGADPRLQDNMHRCPLFISVYYRKEHMQRLLEQWGGE